MDAMKRRLMVMAAGIVLLAASGCGLAENEAAGLVAQTSLTCPERPQLGLDEAAVRAELVVHARPTESFFVDHCHRAFLLDVESVLQGELPDPVLAIVRVDPLDYADRWVDLGRGETAVFLLERDPDVPDAFRPVGDANGVLAVDDDLAMVCTRPFAFGCGAEAIELDALKDLLVGFEPLNP
jgi:hypothetical protein